MTNNDSCWRDRGRKAREQISRSSSVVLVTQHRRQHRDLATKQGPWTQNRQLQHTGRGHMSSTGKPAVRGMLHTPVGSSRARGDILGRRFRCRLSGAGPRRPPCHDISRGISQQEKAAYPTACVLIQCPLSSALAGTDRNMAVVGQWALTKKDMPSPGNDAKGCGRSTSSAPSAGLTCTQATKHKTWPIHHHPLTSPVSPGSLLSKS